MRFPIHNRAQNGMVLIITVIMLAVITLMAVAYIAFARRERVSVVMSVTRTETQLRLDQVLAEAGRALEDQLQRFQVPNAVVSTANSNQPPAGFYTSAQLGSLAQGDLPPVTYDHNNDGTADEFRYWLDLNRDNRFQPTGRYHFIPGRWSWIQARDIALQMGGHLATLRPNEVNQLPQTLQVQMANQLVWIGGYQATGAAEPLGGWNWITGGGLEGISQTWAPNQPDNLGGGAGAANVLCLTFSGGQWNVRDETAINPNVAGFLLEFETKQIGDPQWAGQLQSTNSVHHKTNRFVARHAFMALPSGMAIDLNTAHNRNKQSGTPADYLRGMVIPPRNSPQIMGASDLSLAGLLHTLNPAVWNYRYAPGIGNPSQGAAFWDAQSLFDFRNSRRPHRDLVDLYRLQNNPIYTNLASRMYRAGGRSFYQLAGSAGVVPRVGLTDKINLNDLRSTISTSPNGYISNPVSDIDPVQNIITLRRPHMLYNGAQVEFIDASPPLGPVMPTVSIGGTPNFMPSQVFFAEVVDANRLRLYARRTDPSNPDPSHLANLPNGYLVDFLLPAANRNTGAQVNLAPGSTPYILFHDAVLNAFEQIADRLLRDSGRPNALHGLSRLKVFGSTEPYPWDYDAETHRLLQVAANITDTYSPGVYPSVFRPVLSRHVDGNGAAFTVINSFKRESDANFLNATNTLELLDTNNVPPVTPYGRVLVRQALPAGSFARPMNKNEGFPLVIGVKNRVSGTAGGSAVQQIFPNLNEVALEIFVREMPAPGGRINRILSGRLTWEAWNSTGVSWPFDIRVKGRAQIYANDGNNPMSLRGVLPINFSGTNRYFGSMFVELNRNLIPITVINVPANAPPLKLDAEVRLEFQMKNSNRLLDHASLVLRPQRPINLSFDLTSSPLNQGAWAPGRTYQNNQIVRFNNLWWMSLGNFTSGNSFNSSAWVVLNEKRVEINWQANDPLVNDLGGHYTANQDVRNVLPWTANQYYVRDQLVSFGASRQVCITPHQAGTAFTQANWRVVNQGLNIAFRNDAYQPWVTANNQNIQNIGRKDPGITSAYAWRFPNQTNPDEPPLSLGQLGRIHRGTPWQTLYLKSLDYTGRAYIASKRMINNGTPPAPGAPAPMAAVYNTAQPHSFRTGDQITITGSSGFNFQGPINYYIRLQSPSGAGGAFSLHTTEFSAAQSFPIHAPQDINLNPLAGGGWLKAESPDAWRRWAGYPETKATNDWRILDHFTSLQKRPGATRGLLSVNQPHHAAWAAALSGIPVNTPTGPHYIHSSDGNLRLIVDAVNDHRMRHHNGRPYERISDILGASLLTDGSPYLRGIAPSDQDIEAIPEHLLPLLRASRDEDPYAMLYGFAQTLRPADNSIELGSGIVTNYVITGEQAGRAVAWIANRPRERWSPRRWYQPGDVVWAGSTNVFRCAYNKGLKRHLANSVGPAALGGFWEEVPSRRGLGQAWVPEGEYYPGQNVRRTGRLFSCLRHHIHEVIPPERQPWLWQEVYTGPLKGWGSPAATIDTARNINNPNSPTVRVYTTTVPHPFASGDIVQLTGLPAANLGPLAGQNLLVRMDYGTQEFSLRFAANGAPVPPVAVGGLVTVTLISRTIRHVKGEHVMWKGGVFRCITAHNAAPNRSPDNSTATWVPERVRLQMESFEPLAIRQPK